MTEATQTATTDAREASMSRVTTQDTILANVAPQEAAKQPAEVDKTDADKTKDAGEAKTRKGPHERIQELVTQRKEAEAKADAAERKAADLEARMQALSTSAKPMEVDARPLRSQFTTEDEYVESLTDWKAKKAIQQREAEQAQARMDAESAEIASQWSKRQEQVMKTIPDYADVIGKSEIQIPDHVHMAIMESDQGPQIAYYLALQPEEAKQIAKMKPIAAIKRIAALERDLAAIDDDADTPPKVKEEPAKPQRSKAPEPIDPPRSNPSSGGSSTSYEEYKRRRKSGQ